MIYICFYLILCVFYSLNEFDSFDIGCIDDYERVYTIGETFLGNSICDICVCLKRGNIQCTIYTNCSNLNCRKKDGFEKNCCRKLKCKYLYLTSYKNTITVQSATSNMTISQKRNYYLTIVCIFLLVFTVIIIIICLKLDIGSKNLRLKYRRKIIDSNKRYSNRYNQFE